MKKLLSLALALIIALSLSAGAFAADEPSVDPLSDAKRNVLPHDPDCFDYSFENSTVQYSDFIFSISGAAAAVHILFSPNSSTDHTVTAEIVNSTGDEVVHTFTATVNEGSESEYVFMTYQLDDNFSYENTYYIRLSNPSTADAVGTVSVFSENRSGEEAEAVHRKYDTDTTSLREKHLAFASQYDYHEGDTERSFERSDYYTSGIEYRADGSEYECPAIYIDASAMLVNDFDLTEMPVKIIVDGEEKSYSDKCAVMKQRVLIPLEVFSDLDCEVSFDEETYVATISRGNTVLEILPNLIGMRKDRAEGYYVPLRPCARFVDDALYVPVRAIAEELDISVEWDSENRAVILNSGQSYDDPFAE